MFRAWMLVIAVFFTNTCLSASFNCDQAKSRPEILICGVPELSRMDDELYQLYQQALKAAPDAEQFKRESRAAWTEREKQCRDQACLVNWFTTQKSAMLAKLGRLSSSDESSKSGTTPYSRAKIQPTLDTYEKLNDKCRGGSGDDPSTQVSCDRRDTLMQTINGAGWCWGSRSGRETEADKAWQLCDAPLSEKRPSALAPTEDQATKTCRQDLQCWAARFKVEASAYCLLAIQDQTKYDLEWTDGITRPLFTRLAWADQGAAVVRYFGDEVKLQNGLGNFVRHHYDCDFDTASKKVLRVSIEPGRL